MSDASTAIFCKLFWLISSLGPEHVSARDLVSLFRLLRRVVERRSPPLLCRLMLSSFVDMAAGSNPATSMFVSPNATQTPPPPSCCFDFSGTQSALALPPVEKLTANKGYTVSIWVRWEKQHLQPSHGSVPPVSSSSVMLPVAQPVSSSSGLARPSSVAHLQTPPPLAYLYSFLTEKARGIEALVGKSTGHIVVRSSSRGVMQEVDTKVTLPDRRWCFLTIWSDHTTTNLRNDFHCWRERAWMCLLILLPSCFSLPLLQPQEARDLLPQLGQPVRLRQ